MPKRKIFAITSAPVVGQLPRSQSEACAPADQEASFIAVVLLPADSNRIVSELSFKAFYGLGFDAISGAVVDQIQRLIEGKDRIISPSTLRSLAMTGAKVLLQYCAHCSIELHRPLTLRDIDSDFVKGLLLQIKSRDISFSSQKRIYDYAKTLLRCLQSRGLVSTSLRFPHNPFPNSRRNTRPETPYSTEESRRIARALRDELVPLFEHGCKLTPHLASCALLTIALRTGQNLTPLLEMRTDCLRPHFKDELSLLVLTKRRSRRELSTSVPMSSEDTSLVGILPGTARLIRRVLELTAAARPLDPSIAGALWLIVPKAYATGSQLLAAWHVRSAGRRLARRHELLHDDGRPLRIVVSKMRKTFSNRIYEIAGGDIGVAANAAGHSPGVAASHYLAADRGAAKRWSFMGAVLQAELANGSVSPDRHLTPSGRCRNTRTGEFAPRDGSTCAQFLDCFRCRDYVVTGDDLHKVYSLYWLLVREREAIDVGRWEKLYAGIMRVIDRDIAERGILDGVFTSKTVANAKESARHSPHPLWAHRAALSLA